MAKQLFANNIRGNIVGQLTAAATTIRISNASAWPVPTGGDWFMMTITTPGPSTQFEIVKVTANNGTNFTIVRAQEGTTAKEFTPNSPVEMRVTAGTLEYLRSFLSPSINANEFGVVGDGVTDNTAAFQAAIDFAKTNGYVLAIPAGIYRSNQLVLSNGTRAWGIRGEGSSLVKFEHLSGNGQFMNCSGSTVPFFLDGFSIDCRFAETAHAGASHGISIGNTTGVRLNDVRVRNYKNSSILVFGTVPFTYSDCVMTDCHGDGLGVSANGLLIAAMDRSGFIKCSQVGTSKDNVIANPGYGIQLKNEARWCFIDDCYAEHCVAGVAFGNDQLTVGVQFSTVTNCRIKDCLAGIVTGFSENNVVTNMFIDMTSSNPGLFPGENAIDLGTTSSGNTLTNIHVRNIRSNRAGVRFRDNSSDNNVHFGMINTTNSTGQVAIFDNGSQWNYVKLSRQVNPRVRPGGISTMCNFVTPADANAFSYDGYPMMDTRVIASDMIDLRNSEVNDIAIDTEGAAATDNLSTINNPFLTTGQRITLRTTNDTRDVVIKHLTGNISLVGAADFTLTNRRSSITLEWFNTDNRWVELSRAVLP